MSGFNYEKYSGVIIILHNFEVQVRHTGKTNTLSLRPHLLWPEGTSLLCVLQIVSDDVSLLEEQAHGVGQLSVPPHLGVLQLGRREQLRQANTNQPCHEVAILHRE